MKKDTFVKIRPYTDEELPYAINRMLQNHGFISSLMNFMPDEPLNVLVRNIRKMKTCFEFQKNIFGRICQTFIDRSIDDLTVSGFERLDKKKAYLYIANHRDIIMDSAIMQLNRLTYGLPPCRSGIGDNLLATPVLTDVAKSCNMFTITRTGDARQLLTNSKLVSEYIRRSICEEKESIWIAQRNGRTKDGLDKTQQSVLKMFCISDRKKNIYDSIRELNIVPLTISYEFEPCDQMKARELILSENNKKYTKAPNEDFDSITTGVFAYKSRVHLQYGEPINDCIDESLVFANDNEKIQYICSLIDKQMYKNYRLWPNNYIAYDTLNNSNDFQNHYTEFSKRDFIKHIRKQANVDDVSYAKMKQMLYSIYANPVMVLGG
jgi:1-acyl-sn-glycerol-3-phosphate acyltransferase